MRLRSLRALISLRIRCRTDIESQRTRRQAFAGLQPAKPAMPGRITHKVAFRYHFLAPNATAQCSTG